ncbi:type I restriction enzyme HsdR N-terminal domain-containing protein [Rossellomorea marisflavi]|uniref:type I restriction enzyme HsdR N-terminal domain-containing protein n=1 Tax=Rossellomorea marisflavi TaxID=189381 RepID=UPI003FA1859D
MYDPCRQIFVPYTPEEEVRQKVVQILIEKLGIPKESISTEFPLSRIDPTTKKRADVVVWKTEEDGRKTALMVLELKAAHLPYSDHALEQVLEYNTYLKAEYVGVSNGDYSNLYKMVENKPAQLQEGLYHYNELLNGHIHYVKYKEMQRLPYELSTYERYMHFLMEEGCIGEGTPEKLHPFLSDLHNYVLSGEVEINGYDRIQKDLNVGYFSFGNASGGSFPGWYRSFIVKDHLGRLSIYRLGMFGTPICKNDSVYGNRSGNTYLSVARDFSGISKNVLQLNLDRYLVNHSRTNEYQVTHTGRKNGFKNEQVIHSVGKWVPKLIHKNKVILGTLPSNRSISTIEGSRFINNLIEYACARECLSKL